MDTTTVIVSHYVHPDVLKSAVMMVTAGALSVALASIYAVRKIWPPTQ